MPKSLTVVIPAFNEQDNLDQALNNVLRATDGLVDDLEILVINDGSQDQTGTIARQRALADPRIQELVNEKNKGYGFSYWRGVQTATKSYVGVYTADNDMSWESFRDLVKNIGQADILSSYMNNTQEREWPRRVLSKIFVVFMNIGFGLRLKYINGPFIARRDILQSLTLRSQGLTALAECKVKLIKQGYSCMEIPFDYVRRQNGRSSALSFKSIKAVLGAVIWLYRDIYRGRSS